MTSPRVTVALLGLALAGLCLPTTAWTADVRVLPAPPIGDVSLRNDGMLVGQMVNGQNAPQSGIRVSLQDMQNREVAAAVTDRQGAFAISGVRGGVYQLVTPQDRQVYRIWSPGMARLLQHKSVCGCPLTGYDDAMVAWHHARANRIVKIAYSSVF